MRPADMLAAKLDRANELLHEIADAVKAFEDTDPTVFRMDHDPEACTITAVVESVSQPPLRLAILVGDFAHNLRTTLDHLVWQLALTTTLTPHHRHAYPVYVERRDWDNVVADRLRDVPEGAVALIEATQPYHDESPEENLLSVLSAIDSEDKHRIPLRAVGLPVEPSSNDVVGSVNEDVDEEIAVEMFWGKPLEPGIEAMRIRYQRIGPNPRIEVQASPPQELLFGSRALRASMLPDLFRDVRLHVERFGCFLRES